MSGEIEIGACYRDPSDGEVVRPVERYDNDDHDGRWSVIVVVTVGYQRAGERAVRQMEHGVEWERVTDPTPAVIDDAEPPLAGEMTLRQFFSWAVAQDVDGRPVIRVSRDARGWRVALSVCPPHVSGVPRTTESIAIDPQDAFTALMSKVGP